MKPAVSIIVPLFNDEEWLSAALESCLNQSFTDLEVVCVDDASTDSTASIAEDYATRDSRVRLIRQPENASAFQARRAGVDAAAAPYIMFLDGDDQLAPNAVEAAVTKARATSADVVGFGVDIITVNSGVPRRFEQALQPRYEELHAPEIVSSLFPAGEVANGHLWRYLFATPLLRAAYSGFPSDVTYYRANDLPITFLALAHATKYVSIPDRLYRYNFQRGTSGHAIDNVEHFEFLLSGIDPVTAIEREVHSIGAGSARPDLLVESFESARLHIIGNVLKYCIRDTAGELQKTCLQLLKDKVGDLQVTRAAAGFLPSALDRLSAHATHPNQPATPTRSVLLSTAHLGTGGLQAVLLNQARSLVSTGYKVTIAVMRRVDDELAVPEGIDVVVVEGNRLQRLDQWVELCQKYSVDIIIDHHLLYNDNWPWFALVALAIDVPTIGWIHNFALRPIFDSNQRSTFLASHMPILFKVVTLSPTDVAFWKMHGIEHAVYLPNPPSDLSLKAREIGLPRTAPNGRWELAWWGRLDRATKQVTHIVEAAGYMKKLGIDFRLTIIGPDSNNLTAADVRRHAVAHDVDDLIDIHPGLDSDDLLQALSNTHVMLSASAIEGYQLTIIEAQALGIPVVLYDLPWLTTVRDNPGLVKATPGEPRALASAIVELAQDSERYAELSRAGIEFADASMSIDIGNLLTSLFNDELPAQLSPEPTFEDARILTQLLVRYAEKNIRQHQRARRNENGSEGSDLRRQRDRALSELRSIKSGPSFRIGRALTSFPRKVRDFARSSGKAGLLRSAPNTATKSAGKLSTPPPPHRALPSASRPSRSQTPDVSFIIPVYNSAPWLEDCVSSVLAQANVDVEVICIDDGSTDESGEILRRLAQEDPRVTVVSQKNSGQSVGRNRGLELAAGRYFVYLDSDDYWPEDALQTLVQEADSSNLDVLLFDALSFKDGVVDDKTWKRYATYYQRSYTYRDVRSGMQLMADMRKHGDYRPHVGMYMSRTTYVQNLGLNFIPGIVHQDNPYTFRLLLNATRAAHIRVDAYARRLRPGSTITTLNPERSARGYFLSYLEMSRELRGRELPQSAADQVLNIVHYAYEGASKPFANLTDAEAEGVRLLDHSVDAQVLYKLLRSGEAAPLDPTSISLTAEGPDEGPDRPLSAATPTPQGNNR